MTSILPLAIKSICRWYSNPCKQSLSKQIKVKSISQKELVFMLISTRKNKINPPNQEGQNKVMKKILVWKKHSKDVEWNKLAQTAMQSELVQQCQE